MEEGKKIRWTDGLDALWVLLKYRFKRIAPRASAPEAECEGGGCCVPDDAGQPLHADEAARTPH